MIRVSPDMTVSVSPKFDILHSSRISTKFRIGVVPLHQFQYREKRVLTRLVFTLALLTILSWSIDSETKRSKAYATFLYNQNSSMFYLLPLFTRADVLVGQLLSNGYSLDYEGNFELSGIMACVRAPVDALDEWRLRYGERSLYTVILIARFLRIPRYSFCVPLQNFRDPPWELWPKLHWVRAIPSRN